MLVKLIYFKPNGSFYSSGEYLTEHRELFRIHDEVVRLANDRRLPGLLEGHSNFIVSIDVPENPLNHPKLVNVIASVKDELNG